MLVRQKCLLSSVSGEAASIQVAGRFTFHDVKEKVLPADPILMLRSGMPSRLRKLTC